MHRSRRSERISDLIRFLELNEEFTREDLETNYRKLAFLMHPDHGGSDTKMQKLNNAKLVLEEHLDCRKPSIA